MQTKNILYFLLTVAICAPTLLYADMTPEEDAVEFFDFSSGLPDISDELVKDCPGITPFSIVTILTSESDAILLQQFLQTQIYKSTAPVVVRSLFDNPNLAVRRVDLCDGHNQLSAKFFFNQMRKAFLTPCSPFIDSYLAITDPEVTAEIDRLSQALKTAGLLPQAIDIPIILPLFAQIKLEERRLGAMLAYQRRDGCFEWAIQTPLYYFEHNFFLTKKEQEAIANAPLFKELNASEGLDDNCNENEVETFLTEHVVNDLVGIGDTRITVLGDVINTDCFIVSLGAELDLPTAIILQRGIIGKRFTQCPAQPPFDYFELMCLARTNPSGAQLLGTDFGVGALDRLTQIAGLAHLGSQHVGLGVLAETLFEFDEALQWRNKLRLFYSFNGNEQRFFRTIKNPAEFNREYDDIALAVANERFLSEQTVLYLYPPAVIADVTPGVITEFTSSLFWNCGCVKAELGYDIWYQGDEKLHIVDYLSAPRNLDICSGLKHSATQHKVFATVWVDRNDGCYDWRFGFFGDATFANQGIGKDWTLGVDLRTLF